MVFEIWLHTKLFRDVYMKSKTNHKLKYYAKPPKWGLIILPSFVSYLHWLHLNLLIFSLRYYNICIRTSNILWQALQYCNHKLYHAHLLVFYGTYMDVCGNLCEENAFQYPLKHSIVYMCNNNNRSSPRMVFNTHIYATYTIYT